MNDRNQPQAMILITTGTMPDKLKNGLLKKQPIPNHLIINKTYLSQIKNQIALVLKSSPIKLQLNS